MTEIDPQFQTGILDGVIVDWARVHEPGGKYNKYSLDVRVDDRVEAMLETLGLAHRIKDATPDDKLDRDRYIKFILAPQNSKGQDRKVDVVDARNNPITDLIGNGSKCNVMVTAWNSESADGGRTAKLDGVQVIELVAFSNKPSFGTVAGGYAATEPSKFEEYEQQEAELATTGTGGDPL